MSRLGRAIYLLGKYPEAESLLSRVVEDQRRVVGPDHPDTLYSVNSLAVIPLPGQVGTGRIATRSRAAALQKPDLRVTAAQSHQENLALFRKIAARPAQRRCENPVLASHTPPYIGMRVPLPPSPLSPGGSEIKLQG